MTLVSVLLPVRDGGRFLEEAVRSLLVQTHRDLEVLVVDDGSTDDTPAVLQRLARDDRRLRVLRQDRSLGVAGALAVALQEARGPLVARMDADDVCHPDRLAQQVSLLRARPDLSGCGTAVTHVDRRGRPLPAVLTTVPLGPDGVRLCTLVSTPLLHPTVMLRTQALRAVGGYDPAAVLEDLDLWLRCTGEDLANLAQPLLRYRVHRLNSTPSARAAGARALVPRHSRVLCATLGRTVPSAVSHLLLDPRSAGRASVSDLDLAVAVLDELVARAGADRRAVLDRALSTVAVLVTTRARARARPPDLRGARHLSPRRVAERCARGGWVAARRVAASAWPSR